LSGKAKRIVAESLLRRKIHYLHQKIICGFSYYFLPLIFSGCAWQAAFVTATKFHWT